jgi:pimeloyl-ACP methyl ester carboxylesterase
MTIEVEHLRVPVRGFTFDALAAGPVDGEPVLLLHGFPQTNRSFRSQLDVLAAAGYRAVAPNQRGYSPDARPTEVEAYHHLELVADVLAMADHLEAERIHLVGHDWGAAVAWQVAGRHPDRLRTLTSLSVPHPRAFGEALADPDSDQTGRSSYIEMFRAEGAELGMLANDAAGLRLIYLGAGMSDDEARSYLDELGTPEALGAALNWYRAASLTAVEGLGPITTPTLFIWSTEDPALARGPAEATERFVDGPYRCAVIEGVGHWLPEQAADQVNALLLDHLTAHPL